jgi:N-acyl-D-aspartate/D-glutamate deacylase
MSIRSKILTIMLLAIFGGFAVVTAQAQDYDVVILNGRVMDPETKLDAVRNVGIKNGTIALVTNEKITGQKAIDATGHVGTPGFIDIHAWSE